LLENRTQNQNHRKPFQKCEFVCCTLQSFYCQINDTSAVKGLRLQILTLLANPSNMVDIMNELAEYVTDVDTEIAKAAIQ
jgi:hypothetical protein